jgi:hypothetical protein
MKNKHSIKRNLNTEINWMFIAVNRFSFKIDSFFQYSIFSPRRRLYEPEALFDIYPPIFGAGSVLFSKSLSPYGLLYQSTLLEMALEEKRWADGPCLKAAGRKELWSAKINCVRNDGT